MAEQAAAPVHSPAAPAGTKHLPQLADHPWSYWIVHLSAGILVGVILALAPFLVGWIHRHNEQGPFNDTWIGILGTQQVVPIIVSDVPGKEFSLPPYGTSRLPKNVPLVGVPEALGIAELREALTQGSQKRHPELHVRGEYGRNVTELSFVSVGRPSVNEMTRNLVASWNENEKDDNKKLIFENGVTLDGKLVIHYPSHYVVDGGQGTSTPYRAQEKDGRIVKDYGFIVIGKSPYQEGRMVCAVFGVWPQGTQAAVEALIRPDSTSDYGKQLLKRIRERRGVVAIVETQVRGLSAEGPKLVAVRPLESQP